MHSLLLINFVPLNVIVLVFSIFISMQIPQLYFPQESTAAIAW
jgi:hypothetical protein